MRCPNCGYVNPENSVLCHGCKRSLSDEIVLDKGGHASDQPIPRSPTLPVAPNTEKVWTGPVTPSPATPAPSVVETSGRIAGSQPSECPHCHYVLVVPSAICPNCQKLVDAPVEQDEPATTPPAAVSPTPDKATALPEPTPETEKKRSTIDPYRMRVSKEARLLPVARVDENAAPPPVVLESSQGIHQLNRAKLDPNNVTITSATQAQIEFRDGQWFLIDCSEHRTTFIQAKEPVALKKGDLILMGDRKFVFDPDASE